MRGIVNVVVRVDGAVQMSRINQRMTTVQTPGNYLVESFENYFDNSTLKQSREVRLFCKHLTCGDKLNLPPAGGSIFSLISKRQEKGCSWSGGDDHDRRGTYTN